jgi:hypothetical protein
VLSRKSCYVWYIGRLELLSHSSGRLPADAQRRSLPAADRHTSDWYANLLRDDELLPRLRKRHGGALRCRIFKAISPFTVCQGYRGYLANAM